MLLEKIDNFLSGWREDAEGTAKAEETEEIEEIEDVSA